MQLLIDNVPYTVGTLSLKRMWEVEETYRVTTEDGSRHRQVRGVYPSYSLMLGNVDADTYDALVAQLTMAAESQSVQVPDGKNGFLTYEAMFTGITDELLTERNGVRHWDNLTVTFTAKDPLEGGAV